MKKFLIPIVLVIIWLVSYCGEETPPPTQQPAQKPAQATGGTQGGQSTAVQTGHQAPADQTLTKQPSTPWPFIQDEAVELAENLTAKNYLLIFDGSGSMNDVECSGNRPKIEVARDAVTEWSTAVDADANLGLVAFNWKGWYTEPLAPGQRQRFIDKVRGVEAGGKTPLSKAVSIAYDRLTEQGRRQLGYGEYTIIIVTDGIANNEALLASRVRTILSASPINIHTIGFCIGEDHSLNQPGLTIYKSADNPAELRKRLQEVLAESQAFDDTAFND